MQENKEQQQKTLEENFQSLQEYIDCLSKEDISLEDAFSMYSRGMELLKVCNEQIDQVEKKVLILSGDMDIE